MLDCNISINNTNEIHVDGIINFDNAEGIMELGCHFISKLIDININLQNLKHSDSSGLAVILAWVRLALKSNKVVNIYHMPKFLSDLSKVSNLEQVLPIANSP
jgi:phospholipid transport system transporter-binding protein